MAIWNLRMGYNQPSVCRFGSCSISELIEKQISQLLSEPNNRKEVMEYIQSLQNEMNQKGLTQEILDDLLK